MAYINGTYILGGDLNIEECVEWGVIKDTYLTEDTENVLINTDENGEAFALEKAKIMIQTQPCGDNLGVYSSTNIAINQPDNTDDYWLEINGTTSAKALYHKTECRTFWGVVDYTMAPHFEGIFNDSSTEGFYTDYPDIRCNERLIKSLHISPNMSGYKLGKGTHIIVHGVRAKNPQVTATFEASEACTIMVNGGLAMTDGGSINVKAGDKLLLEATVGTGIVFKGWKANGETVSTLATYVATVTEDTTFIADWEDS